MPLTNPDILRPIPLFQMLDDAEALTLAKELDEIHFLAGQKYFLDGGRGRQNVRGRIGQGGTIFA